MTLNLSIVELAVLFFCAVTLGIVIHFFITSRRNLKSSSPETEKSKHAVDEWKLKYFNEIEKKEKDIEEMQSLLLEAQESSQIYKEQVEELRLKRRSGPVSIEVGEERVVRVLLHQRRVEPGGKALGQGRLANANRALESDVAELQRGRSIAARFRRRQAMAPCYHAPRHSPRAPTRL